MVEILQNARARQCVGRRTEIDALCELAEARRTSIAAVHGIAGVGKSTLLRAVGAALSRSGRRVVLLDCRVIEPTERGFLGFLCDGISVPDASAVLPTPPDVVLMSGRDRAAYGARLVYRDSAAKLQAAFERPCVLERSYRSPLGVVGRRRCARARAAGGLPRTPGRLVDGGEFGSDVGVGERRCPGRRSP